MLTHQGDLSIRVLMVSVTLKLHLSSGYKMLNRSMDPVQLEDDVLVCFTGTLDDAIMFFLGIGTNPVSEFETTPARILSAGTRACMWVCTQQNAPSFCTLYYLALPFNDELASPVSSRGGRPPAPADPVAAMWRDIKSLVANEVSKINEKFEPICQQLSSLENKVQALEAAGTSASTDPETPAKRKRRTPLSLQVCQL